MTTQILRGEAAIKEGARLLKAGELVAFPTETVYGLGANALDEAAVQRIYLAKGRPDTNPLIVHLWSNDQLTQVAETVPDAAYRLFETYAPGPLTIVLPKRKIIPDCVTAGLNTVGIRFPLHPDCMDFLRASALPVAAPSANASKRTSPTTAQAVFEDMSGKIPLIIDGGKSSIGIESTVLSLSGEDAIILRPGAITPSMLNKVLHSTSYYKGRPLGSLPSPGMAFEHYRTTCDMLLCACGTQAKALYDMYTAQGQNCVLFCREQNAPLYEGKNVIVLGNTDQKIASNIYDCMRTAEKRYSLIICERMLGSELSSALMNRLTKAANVPVKPTKRVLFICLGNICRSPAAEVILRNLAAERGLNLEVASAGLSQSVSRDIYYPARMALAELGLAPDYKVPSTQFEQTMVAQYDAIITMEQQQKRWIGNYPNVYSIDEITSYGEIADPWGGSHGTYIECYKKLNAALVELINSGFFEKNFN